MAGTFREKYKQNSETGVEMGPSDPGYDTMDPFQDDWWVYDNGSGMELEVNAQAVILALKRTGVWGELVKEAKALCVTAHTDKDLYTVAEMNTALGNSV